MTEKTEVEQTDLEILPELRGKDANELNSGILAEELRGKTPEELAATISDLLSHPRQSKV